MTVPGSSRLDSEQSDWFHRRHGVRYVAVQDNADRPSRAVRRAQKSLKKKRR